MRIYGSIVYIPSMSWSPLICPMGSEYPETYTSAISPVSSRAGGRAGPHALARRRPACTPRPPAAAGVVVTRRLTRPTRGRRRAPRTRAQTRRQGAAGTIRSSNACQLIRTCR